MPKFSTDARRDQSAESQAKVPEPLDCGYHETLRLGWMHLMHCDLGEFGSGENADTFLDQHTQLLAKLALRPFHSRDHILSAEAKARVVELVRIPSRQGRTP